MLAYVTRRLLQIVMFFPGLAIGGLVLGLNLLGDALERAGDPRGSLRRAAF